jgi:DnaJ like chaperone protein
VVGNLTVYPSRLQHGDTRCNFRDIEHIGWYWHSQTINLFNFQHVKLTLHVKGLSRPIVITRGTMYVTPKLVTAYQYIAQQTFKSRLSAYTDQLEERGAFRFAGTTFYSDGRILSNQKEFRLQEASFEAFALRVKLGGLLGPRLTVDLTTDRDVIVSLLTFILRNPKSPAELKSAARERRRAQETCDQSLVDVIAMLARVASADGEVKPSEVAVIRTFASDSLHIPMEKMGHIVAIFDAAIDSPQPFEYFARSFHYANQGKTQLFASVLDLLFSVAAVDRSLSAEEELLLVQAETIFGVKGPAFTAFRTERATRQGARRREETSREQEYLRTLGLAADARPPDIKARYRRLVMQYHPDRVQHLGHRLRDEAEQKIKDINVAYEFFARKYAM